MPLEPETQPQPGMQPELEKPPGPEMPPEPGTQRPEQVMQPGPEKQPEPETQHPQQPEPLPACCVYASEPSSISTFMVPPQTMPSSSATSPVMSMSMTR